MTRLQLITSLVCLFVCLTLCAAEPPVRLESPNVNIHNRDSLLRGAKFFKQQCAMCHTLRYMRHDPIAKKANIRQQTQNIDLSGWNFQITPPDLSLEVRRRGADWVYTYLMSFYQDPSQPNNTNNLVLHNTQMPNMTAGLHGSYKLIDDYNQLHQYGSLLQKPAWYNVLAKQEPGSLSQKQFEQKISDLVNFLTYASDPKAPIRHQIGIWVLFFLLALLILAWLLKREYWKDINQSK